MINYYRILEVSRNASTVDIKKAYKKLALQWHPDKNLLNVDVANKKFREICEAYEILSDKVKRSVYDRYGKDGLFSSDKIKKTKFCNSSRKQYKFTDPEEIFREFFDDSFFNKFFSGCNTYTRDDKNRDHDFLDSSNNSLNSFSRSSSSNSTAPDVTYYKRTFTSHNRCKRNATRTISNNKKEVVIAYVNDVSVSKFVNKVPQKQLRTRYIHS